MQAYGAMIKQRDFQENDSVHLWYAWLDRSEQEIGYFAGLLSQEERQHAERFRFSHDRYRYIVRRGILRTLLSEYIGQEPHALRLAKNPFGKPYIQDGPRSLGFNVSHSQGLAAIAVSETRDIGVDVEQLRPMEHIPQMVKHFFSPEEQARFGPGSDSDLTLLFFQHWTGKEAYIKALGQGLSHPLDRFSVEVGGSQKKYPIRCVPGSDSSTWFGLALEAPSGYIAALVAPGEHWTVKACGFA